MYFWFILLIGFSLPLGAEGGVLRVEWPQPSAIQHKPHAPYAKVIQEAQGIVELPIYLPARYLEDKTLFMVEDANFYTATLRLDKAVLSIEGDRTFQEEITDATAKLKARITDPTLRFSHDQGIVSTDFRRHNVTYTLELECEDPLYDQRCLADDFLTDVYNDLIFIGGRR